MAIFEPHPSSTPIAVLTAGLRAQWIARILTSPAADALSPREREVLALVAAHGEGVLSEDCVRGLRRSGMTAPAAQDLLQRLVTAGWLTWRPTAEGDALMDLPSEDRDWIATYAQQLATQLRADGDQ